jgi:hypothetical protein
VYTYHAPVDIAIIVEVFSVATFDPSIPATDVLVAICPEEGAIAMLQVILNIKYKNDDVAKPTHLLVMIIPVLVLSCKLT